MLSIPSLFGSPGELWSYSGHGQFVLPYIEISVLLLDRMRTSYTLAGAVVPCRNATYIV